MNRFSSLLLILIIVVSVCLQLSAASSRSFWEDETYTSILVNRGQAKDAKIGDSSHPPLYIYMVIFWGKIFGYGELGLRLLSILFSELTLILTYLLAKDLLGKKTGLIAVTLLAFSPLFLMFGYNARYYSLATFLALLTAYSMWRYRTSGKIWNLAVYVAASISFLYTLYAAIIMIGICNIWWFLNWWREANHSRKSLIYWIIAQLLILVAYYPGLLVFSNLLHGLSALTVVSNGLVEHLKHYLYVGYVYALGETLSPLKPLAWLGGVLILGSGIYAIVSTFRKFQFWLPVWLFVSIVMVGELISGALIEFDPTVSATWQNLPSRALCALPFLIIWIGAGIAAMKPRWMVLVGGLILIVYLTGIYNYFTGAQYLRPIFAVSWRNIFQDIRDHAQPDSVVVCGPGDTACNYYSRVYGYDNQPVSNWENLVESGSPEVWWIEINLNMVLLGKEKEREILDQLSNKYKAVTSSGYGKQDPSIRQLKSKFLGQDNYEYRVVVYRFYNP